MSNRRVPREKRLIRQLNNESRPKSQYKAMLELQRMEDRKIEAVKQGHQIKE